MLETLRTKTLDQTVFAQAAQLKDWRLFVFEAIAKTVKRLPAKQETRRFDSASPLQRPRGGIGIHTGLRNQRLRA